MYRTCRASRSQALHLEHQPRNHAEAETELRSRGAQRSQVLHHGHLQQNTVDVGTMNRTRGATGSQALRLELLQRTAWRRIRCGERVRRHAAKRCALHCSSGTARTRTRRGVSCVCIWISVSRAVGETRRCSPVKGPEQPSLERRVVGARQVGAVQCGSGTTTRRRHAAKCCTVNFCDDNTYAWDAACRWRDDTRWLSLVPQRMLNHQAETRSHSVMPVAMLIRDATQ